MSFPLQKCLQPLLVSPNSRWRLFHGSFVCCWFSWTFDVKGAILLAISGLQKESRLVSSSSQLLECLQKEINGVTVHNVQFVELVS